MSAPRLVVGVDFDGTLAPLARRPGLARLPAAARRALRRLAARPGVLVCVVSGRSLRTLVPKVGLPGIVYTGNHGLEILGRGLGWRHPGAPGLAGPVGQALRRARALAAAVPGAWVEDKGLSLTVHVRAVRRAAAEAWLRRGLARVVRGEPALRLAPGKEVFEVRSRLPWDKGSALLFLRRRLAPGAPIVFIGDDMNDEEAFRRLGRRFFTVKVGKGPTRAGWRARGPRDVARLLAALAGTF